MHLRWSSATNRKTVLVFLGRIPDHWDSLGCYVHSASPRGDDRATPHPREEKKDRRVQAGTTGWGDPWSPSCQPQQAGRRGAAGPGCPHKGSGRTDVTLHPGHSEDHLPSSSTFFPVGSLERERVETSLRMQDLTGSKAQAQGRARPKTRTTGPSSREAPPGSQLPRGSGSPEASALARR